MKTSLGQISSTARTERVPSQVTRDEVNRRTHELALLAGRVPPEVAQDDYEQAKREITGEVDVERQNAALDSPRSSRL